MLKVIIADDEARVCRLVQALAQWDALGMEVAGTASNGIQALELAQKVQPDILITDIRMPGCHGLELIERVKKLLPQLEIVIISGYARFEYAQSAMRFGVEHYLLKPIQKDELMSTLRKLGERCRARKNFYSDSDTHVAGVKERALMRGRLVEDLALRKLENASAEQISRDYDFTVQPGLLQVALMRFNYDQEQFSGATINVIWEKARKLMESSIGDSCFSVLFYSNGDKGGAVLNYAPENGGEVRRALRSGFNHLLAQRFIFGEISISMALSAPVGNAAHLQDAFNDAVRVSYERLIDGSNRILEGLPPDSGINELKLPERYGRAIESAIDSLNVSLSDEIVQKLERDALATPGVRGWELFDLARRLGTLFVLRVNADASQDMLSDFESRCERCASAGELFECLRDFHRETLTEIIKRRENETQKPIRIAKQYIQRHFSENITLEDVCEATGFSVSYFSVLFKKETGEGFVKYLTRVRIDRAKELLKETGMPVSQICGEVGYGDLKHFNQTFKKATSLSPGQYRKLYS